MFYQQYVGAGAGSSSLNCMYYEIALHGGVCHANNLLDGELYIVSAYLDRERAEHACMLMLRSDGSLITVQSVFRDGDIRYIWSQ